MSRRIGWVAVFLLSLTALARASDVLKAIPDDALAVVLINRLDETSDKIDRLGRLLQAPVQVPPLALIKTVTGIHEGLDEKASAAVVVLAGDADDSPPVGVLLVPVTDYAKLLAQLGTKQTDAKIVEVQIYGNQLLLSHRGDFAVFALPAGKEQLEHVCASAKSLAAELEPESAALAEADVAVVVSQRGLQVAADRWGALIDPQGLCVGEFRKELKSVRVSARLESGDHLRCRAQVTFRPAGTWARVFTAPAVQAPSLWKQLPAVPYLAAADISFSKFGQNLLQDLVTEAIAESPALERLTREQKSSLIAQMRQVVANVQRIGLVIGTVAAGEPLFIHTFGAIKVQDSAQFLRSYERTVEQLNAASRANDLQEIIFQVERQKWHDMAVLRVAADVAAVVAVKGPHWQGLVEKVLGRQGKCSLYLAAADPQTVLVTYFQRENLAVAITTVDAKEKSLAGDLAVVETLARLPADSQATMCLSSQGIMNLIQGFAARHAVQPGEAQLPIEIPPLEFPQTPPVGAALNVSSAGLRGELFVPAAVIEALGKFGAGVGRSP